MTETELTSGELLLYAALAFLVSQVLLYAAREPIHRGLASAGQLLSGLLRLAARWCRGIADSISNRNREVIMGSAQVETENRLEREFTRIEAGYAKELVHFPDLHCKLDSLVTELESDLRSSSEAPPEVPGWPEAVKAVVESSKLAGHGSGKVLGGMRNMAVSAEKRAVKDYREAVAKRHRILSSMAPRVRSLKAVMDKALHAVATALEYTVKIDAHMERYEKIRRQDAPTERALAASSLVLFLISAVVLAVAAGGAFVNFHLIALPMSELVPAGDRVAGVPVSTIAALVIVLMEAATGVFVMEALGITSLFPRMATLSTQQRRLILGVAFGGLLALASIEASLAFLREQIVEADLALKQSLAGAGGASAAVASAATSSVPVIGQTVLGFILPWILAMVAIPLEMFIESGRHVVGRLLALTMLGLGVVLRLGSVISRYFTHFVTALLDVYLAIPLQLDRLIRKRSDPLGYGSVPRPSPIVGGPGRRQMGERVAS